MASHLERKDAKSPPLLILWVKTMSMMSYLLPSHFYDYFLLHLVCFHFCHLKNLSCCFFGFPEWHHPTIHHCLRHTCVFCQMSLTPQCKEPRSQMPTTSWSLLCARHGAKHMLTPTHPILYKQDAECEFSCALHVFGRGFKAWEQ